MNSLKRYRTWIIIWIIFLVALGSLFVISSQTIGSFSIYTILTHNHFADTILIFLLIPIFSIVAYFLGGYLLTPFLIYLHKKTVGRSFIYGITERTRPNEFKGAFLYSLFPALMAMNVAILLSDEPMVHDFIFSEAFISGTTGVVKQILTLFILLPVTSAIGIGVFSATFFIIDSGIEYTNKEQKKVKRGAFPIELRSMGGYYLYFLKGYAGISIIISIILLISNYLGSIQDFGAMIYLVNLLLWPIMPFIVALFMVPMVILQDYTYERRNKFVKKWAEKFGITGKLVDPLGRD